MKCDMKTILKATAVLGLLLGVVYLTVPTSHTFILASAPVLVALICPGDALHDGRDEQDRQCQRRRTHGAAAHPRCRR